MQHLWLTILFQEVIQSWWISCQGHLAADNFIGSQAAGAHLLQAVTDCAPGCKPGVWCYKWATPSWQNCGCILCQFCISFCSHSDKPNKQVKGNPNTTLFVARLSHNTTEGRTPSLLCTPWHPPWAKLPQLLFRGAFKSACYFLLYYTLPVLGHMWSLYAMFELNKSFPVSIIISERFRVKQLILFV